MQFSTTLVAAILAASATASTLPRSLIPLPSPIHPTTTTTTISETPYPMPTPIPSSSDNQEAITALINHIINNSPAPASTALETREESCWERVTGRCAPFCDDMYPGPDLMFKKQACRICTAVQSAFCAGGA